MLLKISHQRGQNMNPSLGSQRWIHQIIIEEIPLDGRDWLLFVCSSLAPRILPAHRRCPAKSALFQGHSHCRTLKYTWDMCEAAAYLNFQKDIGYLEGCFSFKNWHVCLMEICWCLEVAMKDFGLCSSKSLTPTFTDGWGEPSFLGESFC